MSDKPGQKDDLEDMFRAARQHAPQPSQDLVARIMQDAMAVQPGHRRPLQWLRRSLIQKQGLSIAAGLTAAAIAGFYIGFMSPDLFGWTVLSGFENADYEISYGFSSGLNMFWEEV
ncbi:hypothetical protein [Pseudaestuariivita rosea]|uniref:hypothetical protein n=1 Tax=Pseudaestuariivita rosea TaxID=2763263 RepID=UPI001ABB511D|nr:hypothetical protein [Pseudaestuariivita rosea]